MSKKAAEALGDDIYGITYRASRFGSTHCSSVGSFMYDDERKIQKAIQDIDTEGVGGSIPSVSALRTARRKHLERFEIKNLGTLKEAREAARRKSLEKGIYQATVFDSRRIFGRTVENWRHGEKVKNFMERVRGQVGRSVDNK